LPFAALGKAVIFSRRGGATQQEQSVSEMVEEVLHRQAQHLVARTGMPLEDAHVSVTGTPAGRRLKELGEGEHQHEEARYWQANLWFERASRRVRQRRTA
jgi:hypothetical protein